MMYAYTITKELYLSKHRKYYLQFHFNNIQRLLTSTM
jgi:hypothetical protein